MNNTRCSFSGLYHSPTLRRAAVMLVVVAWTTLAVKGKTVWFQSDSGADTIVSTVRAASDARIMAYMCASAGAAIHFGDTGKPDFVGFALPPGKTIEGEYGIDAKGPKNRGRLIYKQADMNRAMAYGVKGGPNVISIYHLKYLELTTVGNETNGYSAYATKAIAFDNKVETLSQTNTFNLPEQGQLVITNGIIHFGDVYVSPNYDLSGKVNERVFGVGTSTNVTKGSDRIGAPPTNWPSLSSELTGPHEVRVKNPNDFQVRVGLRSGGKGKDFIVSPSGTESVNVANGRYDIYFNYSSDPGGLYQGDSFTLKDNGVEITITKVVNGNYGIRKVR